MPDTKDDSIHPSCGFIDQGLRFNLCDPSRMVKADADVWNDRMYLQIDHRGGIVNSGHMRPDMSSYAQWERVFYVRDNESGQFWAVPRCATKTFSGDFKFSAGRSDIQWSIKLDDIEVSLQVVIPPEDAVELWQVELCNHSSRPRSLSLFSYLPVGRLSWLGQTARYDLDQSAMLFEFFPYHVKHQDYFDLKDGWNKVCALSSDTPDAFMFNAIDFVGQGNLDQPEMLSQKTLPAPERWADGDTDQAAIFQFDRQLEPEASCSVRLAFGPARNTDDVQRITARYMGSAGMENALSQAEARYAEHAPALEIETPDSDFDAYVNHWLPRRTLMQARTNRFMAASQGRNLLQDAMGGALVDPATSRHWICHFYSFQHSNGWMPHGMPLLEGARQLSLNTIPHKDINAWGPSAITFYLYETGDVSILDQEIIFADVPDAAPIALYEHVCRGLEWLLGDRTERGLCRLGEGDWNDPLNMAGCRGKGESVWLSEALAMALDVWIPICERRGDAERAGSFRREADALRDRINELAWDGDWYVRGFTDEGRAFGCRTDEEGRIFLNAQSWAIMCGAAEGERADACIRSVEQQLDTPSGPMVLAPAYTRMHEDIGRLSLKPPGRNENGSVYCHAAVFYAYSLYQVQRGDAAYDVLRKLLCGSEGNPLERAGQLPLYIPNAYMGTPCGAKAGESTHSPNTGTAPWYYRTVVEELFGLRGEWAGLRIDPQLPSEWKTARAIRHWRGSVYEVHYLREAGVSALLVELDGVVQRENLIPADAAPARHQITVRLPLAN